MNVILLAMSTYPREMKRYIATYEEGREAYSYFSQLEPGCKHFIYELGNENQKFDKIIALCTKETLTAPRDIKGPDGEPNKKILEKEKEEGKPYDISDKSPYEFFKDRMISYIKNDPSVFKEEEEVGADTEGITRFNHSELYSDPENLFEFVEVDKGEIEITSTIKNVIGIFDDLKAEKINLYLNAQGGARKNIQIINTVLNMLQSRSYNLSEVSVIDFNGDGNSSGPKILDVTGSYLKNDFAAAMNTFLRYGRADMFVDYYTKYKEKQGISTAPEDDIVKNINNISDAMLMCDIDGFLDCIGDLKESIAEYEGNKSVPRDSFFELIVSDIKNSYRELFDSDDMIADMDVLVDWCLRRKLLQQAVTILESKTPDFVFDYGVLYAKKDKETKDALSKLRDLSTQDYKFKHPKYYIFNKFCHMNTYKKDNSGKNSHETKANLDFEADLDFTKNNVKFKELVNGKYSFWYEEKRGEPVEIRLYSNYIAEKGTKYSREVYNAKENMNKLAAGYRKICCIRNDFNHGNIKLDYESIEAQVRSFNDVLKIFKRISPLMEQEDRDFFEEKDIPKPRK